MRSLSPLPSPRLAPLNAPDRSTGPRRRNPHQQPLSRQLFRAVAGMHREIAHHPFFGALDNGTLTRGQYVAYLRDHLAVCTALEQGLHNNRANVGDIGGLHFERRRAILQDLAKLGEPTQPVSAAAQTLVNRINEASPNVLIVHAWTEYMAMLNGGQGMRPKLVKLFGTAQIVTFDLPASDLIRQYTEALDFRKASDPDRDMMCEEAKQAFREHATMLDEEYGPANDAPSAEPQVRGVFTAVLAAVKWLGLTRV